MRLFNTLIPVAIFFSTSIAKEPLDYKLGIPDNFEQMTSISQISDSLINGDRITRRSALFRLIELDDSRAIPAIEVAYENDPFTKFLTEDCCGIDYYALYGIGRIGGPEAYSYLWKVANELLKPEVLMHPVGDTANKIGGLFEGLAFVSEPESSGFCERIAAKDDNDAGYRIQAYRAFLELNLKKPDFKTPEDTLNYLFGEYRKIYKPRKYFPAKKLTYVEIKNMAFPGVIVRCLKYLPEVYARYESIIPAGDPFKDEYDRIKGIINYQVSEKKKFEQRHNKK
jgi:hypothetical protein